MSLAPQALRELSAETRTFASVQGALLWYRDVLARRLSLQRSYEAGNAPCSDEQRNRVRATAAKITHAIRGLDGFGWLLALYDTANDDGTWLAEQLDIHRDEFIWLCRQVEREARRRLELAGVVRLAA